MMNELLRPLSQQFAFHFVPRHFKQTALKNEVSDFGYLYFYKVLNAFYCHYKHKQTIYKDTKALSKIELFEQVQTMMDKWVERLEN